MSQIAVLFILMLRTIEIKLWAKDLKSMDESSIINGISNNNKVGRTKPWTNS